MSTEINTEIKKRLEEVFPDPDTQAKAVSLLASKRPMGWNKRSHAPYYKPECAKQIKKAIDRMIETRDTIVYRYDVWCADGNITPRTLYLRVNQSIKYLVECLDPEHKYSNWNSMVTVRQKLGIGITIEFKPEFREVGDNNFTPDFVTPTTFKPAWRLEMEEWLESDETSPFIVEKLALSEITVKELKKELAEVRGIMADVRGFSIKIIRINV